jgi:hypothetical protein
MYRKTATVRPVEINGQIVIAPKGQKIAEIRAWYEKHGSMPVADVRVIGLTDFHHGTAVSALIEQAEFTVDELPMVL